MLFALLLTVLVQLVRLGLLTALVPLAVREVLEPPVLLVPLVCLVLVVLPGS